MDETLISDAFYHIHNDVFARGKHCYERVFTKAGREEAIELGLYFVPNLYEISGLEWKQIKATLRNLAEFSIQFSSSSYYAFCPHFFTRGHRLVNDDEEYVDYIEAVGSSAPRGTLPVEMWNTAFVMSKESADEFLKKGFTGVVCQSLVSEETRFPDEKVKALVKERNLFLIRFRSYMDDQTFLRELRTLPPRKCERCGGSIEYCFDCGLELVDCPHCGKRGVDLERKRLRAVR